MTLGASWSGQFVCGAVALAFGIVGGVVARLYFVKWKKLGKIETAIVDFVTTLIISALYLVAVETGGKGQINWYSILLFLLGVVVASKSVKRLATLCARRTKFKFLKK